MLILLHTEPSDRFVLLSAVYDLRVKEQEKVLTEGREEIAENVRKLKSVTE